MVHEYKGNLRELEKLQDFTSSFQGDKIDWPHFFSQVCNMPDSKIFAWRDFRKLNPSRARDFLSTIRPIINNVNVFRLSDDLDWAVTKLSIEVDPRILMETALQARMPFEHTMFIWDSTARLNAFMQLHRKVDNPIPPEDESPFMIVTSAQQGIKQIMDGAIHKNQMVISPLGFWFDPERVLGPNHTWDVMLNKDKGLSSHTAYWMTDQTIEQHPEYIKEFDNDPRFGTILLPPIGLLTLRRLDKAVKEHDQSTVYECMNSLMKGTAGEPRWLAALLTLMEYKGPTRLVQGYGRGDVDLEELQKGSAPAKKRQQKNVIRTVTTFLPREQVVKRMHHHLEQARKKVGNHGVTGHWRFYPHNGDNLCDHQWPENSLRRQVCTLCGALRVRIREYRRGTGEVITQRRRLDYGGIDLERVKTHIVEKTVK